MDLGSFKVHAPTAVVFVCGGEAKLGDHAPLSLRDAFLKISHNLPFSKYRIRKAEDIEFAYLKEVYDELLLFESDIAQTSELIMLFSESAGSIAELGMFVMDDEIAPRLLAIVDHTNFKRDSFIKHGPLHSLTLNYGDTAVCVLNLADIGMERIEKPAPVDLTALHDFLAEPFLVRLQGTKEPRTFNASRNGHITKLIVGLLQHYGALTTDEIEVLLYCVGVKKTAKQISQHVLCGELFGWIYTEKRGVRTFHASITKRVALSFNLLANIEINRTRWRTDIRDHWKKTDANRFGVISTAARMAAE